MVPPASQACNLPPREFDDCAENFLEIDNVSQFLPGSGVKNQR